MSTSAVTVTGLTKEYGRRTAVDRLDIDLPTGVVAGFIGPNGAGKTTTMAMLLGLVRPTSGSGWVLGEPLGDPASYLPRVGALVESPAFYPSLSGAENLALFARVAAKDPVAIEPALATVGLSDRAGDRYRTYSLGMKQRLGIAAALIGEPELLILDEPANGLDPQGVRDIRGLVGSLAGTGRTVLVSSHDLSELEQICDWLVLIDGGRSLYQGPTRGLLDGETRGIAVAPERATDADALRHVLGCNGFELEPGDAIVVAVDGHDAGALAASINRISFDAGIVLAELRHQRTTLEDRYLAMAEGGSR